MKIKVIQPACPYAHGICKSPRWGAEEDEYMIKSHLQEGDLVSAEAQNVVRWHTFSTHL